MTFQSFTAQQYLKIDIANNFGMDKSDWQPRLDWFDKHEHELLSLVPAAEEPALFYAGVKAWEEMKAGQPIGYMISLDGTSSGLQLLACLTGDRAAARLCNVVSTGHREDAYNGIYKTMLKDLGGNGQISRGMTKDAIMTALYGSTAVPKRVFGEGHVLEVFFRTMMEQAPGAWELNEAFLALWDPEATSNDWVMPDNFHVHVKVMDMVKTRIHFLNQPFDVFHKANQPVESGRSLGANMIHSVDGMVVREITRRCDHDVNQVEEVKAALKAGLDPDFKHPKAAMLRTLWEHYQQSGYLSARVLDYLTPKTAGLVDEAVIMELLDSLPEKPFKVVSIHDCFRVHPNYGDDLRKQYNLQLSLIARSNLLEHLLTQLTRSSMKIDKLDPNMHIDVLNTNYALS